MGVLLDCEFNPEIRKRVSDQDVSFFNPVVSQVIYLGLIQVGGDQFIIESPSPPHFHRIEVIALLLQHVTDDRLLNSISPGADARLPNKAPALIRQTV